MDEITHGLAICVTESKNIFIKEIRQLNLHSRRVAIEGCHYSFPSKMRADVGKKNLRNLEELKFSFIFSFSRV